MAADSVSGPEQIVRDLPSDLALHLGVLAEQPDAEVRVNLGLQLYGTALLLETYGLVSYMDYDESALELAKNPSNESAAHMVRVTELGGDVMSLCQKLLPEGDERKELIEKALDTKENRRTIVRGALLDAPHPATMLVHYLGRKKSSPK